MRMLTEKQNRERSGMEIRMKKLLLTMLMATMLVGLTACGGKGEEAPTPTQAPTQAPANNEAQTPENNDAQTPDNNGAVTPDDGVATPDASAKESVDDVAILEVQDAVVALSGQNFGNFMMSEEIFDKEAAGWVLGYEGFNKDFVAASHFAPMMSSTAFELAFFRVAEGTDVQAFADDIRTNADPIKWMCVQAEVVKTAIRGNTILFVMSDARTADALIEAFNSYDPATYVPPVKANPLSGKTMEDLFWDIAMGCGFIEAATDGTYNETSKEKLGFKDFDATGYEDAYVDYSTEGSAYPYAIGLFRLPEGADCYAFMDALGLGVDLSAYGDTADYTLYYDEAERVVAYCAATSYDIVMAFQDGLTFTYPDMFCYR